MKIHINQSESIEHPLLPTLKQVFQESGLLFSENEASVELIMGSAGQGFSQLSIAAIEKRICERFSGAELFLQARAFPFARIRCGLDPEGILVIASPIEEGLIYRLAKLLQQYKQLEPKNDHSIIDSVDVISMETEETIEPSFESSLGHWENSLFALGLTASSRYPIIQEYSSYPAVHHLLQSTTARRVFTDDKDREFAVFGFPDLLRPSSKVLLFSQDGGVLALHRKAQTLILSKQLQELMSIEGHIEPNITEENADIIGFGDGLVYFEKEGIVYSWNGRNPSKLGKKSAVVASLCLQWSGR